MINIPIETANPAGLLTPRQTEALHYAALGKTCAEAGCIMSCSERTAKEHLTNLYHKFNVHNRAQLIAQAFAKGYLKAGHALLLALALSSAFNTQDDYRVQRNRSGSRTTRITRTQRDQKNLDLSLEQLTHEAFV